MFLTAFAISIVLFFLVLLIQPPPGGAVFSREFRAFQGRFLVVFLTMFAGDWLQGPTVYALYEYYGYSRADNGLLFILGFGSSMLFGPFAGSLADLYGRRRMCVAYGIIYSLRCLTKHSRDFRVLLLGRVFGGVATSIVWSGFEAWMVSEHRRQGFPDEWLSDTFSKMTVGNGLIAIPAGLVAQFAVWLSGGHPVAPFDVAFALLILGSGIILVTWRENHGATHQSACSGLRAALHCIVTDRRVFLLGGVQSLFESAMYIFIFIWTPALETHGPVPHGIVFASFMVCCSLGGTLFAALSARLPILTFLPFVFALAGLCLLVPTMTAQPRLPDGSVLCVRGDGWDFLARHRDPSQRDPSRAPSDDADESVSRAPQLPRHRGAPPAGRHAHPPRLRLLCRLPVGVHGPHSSAAALHAPQIGHLPEVLNVFSSSRPSETPRLCVIVFTAPFPACVRRHC